MPLSLPILMPNVLAPRSGTSRNILLDRWKSCTSAQGYLDVVIEAIRASRCRKFGTSIQINNKELVYDLIIDALEDNQMNLADGERVADEALETLKRLKSSRNIWMVIQEYLAEVKRYLLEALAEEELESLESSRAAAVVALRALARQIADKANDADKMALADPTLKDDPRRHETVSGTLIRDRPARHRMLDGE